MTGSQNPEEMVRAHRAAARLQYEESFTEAADQLLQRGLEHAKLMTVVRFEKRERTQKKWFKVRLVEEAEPVEYEELAVWFLDRYDENGKHFLLGRDGKLYRRAWYYSSVTSSREGCVTEVSKFTHTGDTVVKITDIEACVLRCTGLRL